ncbi:MAG TPA: dual specificity protein phosphatase family protein [Stellaceae bacterium]|nr:dual specificity protein phosphatase family protein [Stellaceae bacterium]
MIARQGGWAEPKSAARAKRAGPLGWALRTLKVAAVAIGLGAASLGAYCGIIIYEGNFHAVAPGVFYRSAELSKAGFEEAARQHGIKSVLNLRGAHPGEKWYDDEIAAAHEAGMAHYDYPISAKRFVTAKQVAQILDIVRRAPKPLLVHCMSGADRAGLVSALYEYAIAGESAAEADDQLSLAYGHFPYLTSRSGAMDDSFWAFVRAHQPGGGK